jgi:hypothetical protein
MPKSQGREELTMLIGLEVLIESVAFDTHDLRKLPFRPAFVTKVLKSLRQAGILERVNTRKYLFTDKFVGVLKDTQEDASKRPDAVPRDDRVRHVRNRELE